MIIPKNKKDKLAYITELYERAKLAYSDTLESFRINMEQYQGSRAIDGSNIPATTVRNITYELIEGQISSDIPQPKVDPACYSERRSRCAKSTERLLSSLRDKLPFEAINDIDERYTYIYGGSVMYVEWDNTERCGGEIGSVKVHTISPKDLIPQPDVCEIQDMDYLFLRFTTTKGSVMKKYGIKECDLINCEYEDASDVEGECLTMVIAFYKDEGGQICRYIFSGDTTLEDMPTLYRRKKRVCSICGKGIGECDCEGSKPTNADVEVECADIDIENGEGVMTVKCEIPYYTPRRFPVVIRRNTSGERRLFGQSDCEYIRPEQQAINKIESRILEKLLRAGVTPIVPEDARISLDNSIFGQIIRMKPGESATQYGKVDTTPNIAQDIAEAERLYEHAKRILGISDALVGIDGTNNESGYSRQLRISQATGRLESKRKMKYTAYAELDRIIFELYLAYADEPRQLVYKDSLGRIHNAEFSRYDFIELDNITGELYYNDNYLFSVDLNGGAEYQREALWQRNLENLKAGTLGNPTNPTTLLRYWQFQERAHYPHARENVEYFTLLCEKNEEFSGGDTPE